MFRRLQKMPDYVYYVVFFPLVYVGSLAGTLTILTFISSLFE
jgi:hypothetical protein